jgi:hypothetical protein
VTLPLLFAGAFSLLALVLGDGARGSVLTAENEVGKAVAAAGCLAAALAFERGEYLRRAWTYSGACYVLLLLADAAGLPALGARLGEHPLDVTQGTLVVLANTTSVLGTWMLARAWRVAGLDDEDGSARARRRLLFAAAGLLALAITGWPLVHDVRALLGGDVGALVSIASDLGDTLCLALVAPVLQTALAMRGGVLWWPWGLLTSSGLAWVVYDACSGLVEVLHVGGGPYLVGTEALRALACASFFSAGLAQRRIVVGDATASLRGAS